MMTPIQKTSDQAFIVNGKTTGSLRHNLGFDGATHRAEQERQQAKSLWLNSLDLLESADGSELTRLAHFLNHLASVYEERGDYAKTERLYQRLNRLVERTGIDPELESLRVVVLRRLGSLYQAQGRHDEAESVLRRALNSARTIFGDEHLETAEVFYHLALLKQEREQFDKAAKYYWRALGIFEQTLSAGVLRVADLYHDLSRLECKRGTPAAGEPMARRALQIRTQALGNAHLSVAAEMISLAEILATEANCQQPCEEKRPEKREDAKCNEAERLYRQAIGIIEGNHAHSGSRQYEVAAVLIKLAAIYAARNNAGQAEQCYLRALAIKEKLLGVENLEVAALRECLAALYARQLRHDEASTLSHSARTIFDKATGALTA